MRNALPFLAVMACLGLAPGWLACDRGAAGLDEEARLAIELRCTRAGEHAADECRRVLERVYLAGSLEPDKTLRTWCDAIRTGRWGGSQPPPPEVCVERYGGWSEG